MFSSSHDLSIMKWLAPLNLNAKRSLEFKQDHSTAMILHGAPIVTMAANSFCMVTGDESGKVVISAPLHSKDAVETGNIKPYIEAKVPKASPHLFVHSSEN
jgi:hypothetical protein